VEVATATGLRMSAQRSQHPSVADLRVVECDPRVEPRWEAFLRTHPDALVYHHPAWLDVLAREYGQEPIGLACESRDGELVGVLPLFRGRGLRFRVEGQSAGGRLVSLPRTPVAGPVAADRESAARLLDAAVGHAGAAGVRLQLKVEGRGLDGLVDGLEGMPWLPTYARELPDEPDGLRFGNSRNHARIMWAIGKARKHGVDVRPAESEEDLRAWYRLYLETMRTHAVPPRPYRFFAALWRELRPRGLMRLIVAERREADGPRLLAGSVFLMFGRTVFYAYTGAHAEGLRLRANDVIQWRAMHDAVKGGFRRYDLGEVSEDDPGLVDFKKKWGTTPTLLYRYYHPPLDPEGAGVLESGRRLRTLGSKVWRRLPLGLTAVVGDRLYRYS
jgi:CelD/BcsL family acetyltransferase involved in cellulose biosynthesis